MQLKTFLHRLNVWRSLDPCLGIWQFFLKGNPFTPLFSPRFFSSFFFCILFPFHVNLFFILAILVFDLVILPHPLICFCLVIHPVIHLVMHLPIHMVICPVFHPILVWFTIQFSIHFTIQFNIWFFIFVSFPESKSRWVWVTLSDTLVSLIVLMAVFSANLFGRCFIIWFLLAATYYYSTLKICPKLLWQAPIHI